MYGLQIGRAAHDLAHFAGGFFEQHRQYLADLGIVEAILLRQQELLQCLQPRNLDGLRRSCLRKDARECRAAWNI